MLRDYETFRWRERDFFIQPTPGHTPGSISLVTQIDGRNVVFSGDLMHSPGKVQTLYDLQYYYAEHEGVDLSAYSLAELVKLKPELLCPSHGSELTEPIPGMQELIANLADWYRFWNPGGGFTLDNRLRELTPHIIYSSQTTSSFYAIISDSGKALFIDYGAASWDFFLAFKDAVDPEDRFRFVEHSIDSLRARHGLKSIEVVIPSHMHDDHVNGIPYLTRRYGRQFTASVFVDASSEGDLMKAAGVSYVIGREGRARYGESLAGRQDLLPGKHQFRFPVSADAPGGGLVPLVVPRDKIAQTGESDGRFQSYCFRLCLTDDPRDYLRIERPRDYDPARYILATRYLASAKGNLSLGDFIGLVRIPNEKSDINSTGPVSTDLLGASWEYPEASYARRARIAEEHLTWAQGLIYFLQNNPTVPASIRDEINLWGLPKDEFVDTHHWPPQLYIREGRRMLGEYVLTQRDLENRREKYDSIGMAGYNIDIREVEWVAHKVYIFPDVINQVFTEGYLSMPVEPWEIPYRALLPTQQECSNLLVTICISASTVAYGSFRMEANYMIAGQSAGVAAALAIKSKRSVHAVDITELQRQLRASGQILSVNDVASRYDAR